MALSRNSRGPKGRDMSNISAMVNALSKPAYKQMIAGLPFANSGGGFTKSPVMTALSNRIDEDVQLLEETGINVAITNASGKDYEIFELIDLATTLEALDDDQFQLEIDRFVLHFSLKKEDPASDAEKQTLIPFLLLAESGGGLAASTEGNGFNVRAAIESIIVAGKETELQILNEFISTPKWVPGNDHRIIDSTFSIDLTDVARKFVKKIDEREVAGYSVDLQLCGILYGQDDGVATHIEYVGLLHYHHTRSRRKLI